jgi:cbb3-type cytochrome c oxidase subunit III
MTRRIGAAALLAAVVLSGGSRGVRSAGDAQAPPVHPPLVLQSMYGRDLYEFYCAGCHGRDGRGAGPTAPALHVDPPDLTQIALRNGGVFPRLRIEAIVDGRVDPPLASHGTREMPVWGPIFSGLDGNGAANRVRIENIVRYLETFQARYATPIARGTDRRDFP